MTEAATELVVEIRIDLLDANPNQPRKQFDDELLEELAVSIKTVGIQEPIIVRPVGDRYEIVAGERRTRASTKAGLETVKAIVRTMSDRDMAILALVENVARKDLHLVETATYVKQLVDDGVSTASVCAATGKQEKEVQWMIEIMTKCRDEVIWCVSKNLLSGSMAGRLTKLSDYGQARFLQQIQQAEMSGPQQIGLIEAIWAEENQAEMFADVKLTDEQVTATRSFSAMLDRCVKAVEQLENIEEEKPGTLGIALSHELDTCVEQIGHLMKRFAHLKWVLERQQGQIAATGKTTAPVVTGAGSRGSWKGDKKVAAAV